MQLRTEHIYREFLRLTRRLSNSQIMMLLAVVVGILAGLGTYLFEILLHGIKSGLIRWFPVDSAHVLFLIYPAIGIILATLFVKYIVRDNISEGVTRVLYAMSSRNSRIPGHNCWTSIVGGATTIGFGGSVGPEAPIVLTGAAIGSNVGRLARLNYKHTTLLLCCGAGAALAAIFKAPITGVVFVLEILMLDITAGVGDPAADRLDHGHDDGLHAARLRPHTGRDAPAAGRLRAVADTAFHPARRMLRADVLVFHLDQPARGQLLP